MDFSVQLSAYFPNKEYGGKRLFDDMVEQAVLCDRLGYESVCITEHHLLNILLQPAPLQLAVKIAAVTRRIKIITAVIVLPLHDMRVLAGEIVAADIFTDGRLMLGLGRGAFGFEMGRMGVPLDTSREKFDESFDVLMALLTEEEVSWNGKYYRFEALTIQPRPLTKPTPPIMLACAMPTPIYHCARRGFHVQTTPLSADHKFVLEQVSEFHRGKSEAGEKGRAITLSLSRVGMITHSEADKAHKLELADHYYAQFDNVFTGPGVVDHGFIRALPREQTLAQLDENLVVGSSAEIIDKLAVYAQIGVDRFILNPNFGASQSEQLDTIQCFAEEVVPILQQISPAV